jgi:MFS transporter, OFA family, oxalate/formate antiporter
MRFRGPLVEMPLAACGQGPSIMIRSYVGHIPQRVCIATAAFCMQLALGTVYGWSVFLAPLCAHFDASKREVTLTFTITLAVLGVTASFGGSLQRRIGPRATATLAGILYGSGVFLSGFAPSLIGLYLAHGVLGGIGLGLGYIVPLAVLLGWFPDKRGFIIGLAVADFGLGALVVSPLATELISTYGVQHTLLLLGAAYLAIVVAAAQFLRRAPDDYAPPAWTPQPPSAAGADPTLVDALRRPHWHLQWWMLALNVTAGAALISVAAPLVQELEHVASEWSRPTCMGRAFRRFRGAAQLLRPSSPCKRSPSRQWWRCMILSGC